MKWFGIIFLVLFCSCCPTRQLSTSTTDSVRIVVRDRIIQITDTVELIVPVEVERQIVLTDSSHLETTFAKSDAIINKDGSLYHSIENKSQNRPVEVKYETVVRDSIVYKEKIVNNTVEVEKQLTKWQNTRLQGFWILLAIILVFLFLKIRKLII